MKNITAVATAGMTAVALSIALVGCGSETETETNATSETSTTTASSIPAAAGPGMTINEYIAQNDIAETPIKPGDPGTPEVDFPFPPGWSRADQDMTPDWAYGAIVYDEPEDPSDPPVMYAIAVKLTGDVDAAKVLEYAPNQLNDLPDFTPIGEPSTSSLSGFDAVVYAGTYTHDGKKRVFAQKTVVIPGQDALFALQVTANALDGEQDVVLDAAKVINEQTKITPPS